MLNLTASRGLLRLGAILPMLLLMGCVTTQTTGTTSRSVPPVCSVWKAISYSAKADSSQTVSEIRSSNAKQKAYCSK